MKKYLKSIISAMDLMCLIIVYALVLAVVFDLVLVAGYFAFGWENFAAINTIIALNIAALMDAILVFIWYAFGDNLKEWCVAQNKAKAGKNECCYIDDKKVYSVSLVNYTEENVPDCVGEVFIKTNMNLLVMPRQLLKECLEDEGILEATGCEGVGFVYELNEQKFHEDYPGETLFEW